MSESRKSSPTRSGLAAKHGLVNGNIAKVSQGISGSTGKTNGLVNGLGRVRAGGRVNGLANGHTNGLTNGSKGIAGFINGRGLINGTRTAIRSNPFGIVTHKDLRIGISLAVLFALLLPSVYLILGAPVNYALAFQIDGNLDDWSGFPYYEDHVNGPNANTSFVRYGLVEGDSAMNMFFQVSGPLFGKVHGYDGFYFFVDADGDSSTGYWPDELGAEYVAAIYGGDSRIAEAKLMLFGSTGDNLNWSAWRDSSPIPAAFSGNVTELALPIPLMDLATNHTIRLASNDFQGHVVLSSVRFGREYGALRVEQSPGSLLTPLTPTSEILHLKMRAYGKMVEIPDFLGRTKWQCYPPGLMNRVQLPNHVVIKSNTEESFGIGLDLVGFPRQALVWLNLTEVVADVPVTLAGAGGVGYVEQGPSPKKTDGWFGDWIDGVKNDNKSPYMNPNVDIGSFSSNMTRSVGGGQAFFYVDFRGEAMVGTFTPQNVRWEESPAQQPSQPSPVIPLRRIAGQDVLVFYIDANTSDAGGHMVNGVLADYKLEILGHQRRIDSIVLYTYLVGDWVKLSSAAPLAMVSGSRIEASFNLSVFAKSNNTEVVVEATDWSGHGDITSPVNLETRSVARSARTRGHDRPELLSFPPGYTNVTSTQLTQDPALDGRCDDVGYAEAATVTNESYTFQVGHKDEWVWVCVIVNDHSQDSGDYAELFFDTMHDGGSAPQVDDRHFNLTSGSSLLTRERGDGTNWVACGSGCSEGDMGQSSFFLNNQTYEFRINNMNVWNVSGVPYEIAGFAIHMYNASGAQNFYWGSWTVDPLLPRTWGHIIIPEFSAIILPVVCVAVIVFLGRRLRRA